MDLASEDGHLMAQYHDLDSEVRVPLTGESDELEEAAERPVEEREGHCRMLAAWESGVKVQAEARGWRSRHRQGPALGDAKYTLGRLASAVASA
jgi:hypothetical protein